MAFPVGRVGSLTESGGKVITGASSMYTDFPAGPSISYSHNGQVIVYTEKDIGSEDDDPESDDGLAIKPAIPGKPTAAEIARSDAIKSVAGTPLAMANSVVNNAVAVPQDCSQITGAVAYSLQLSPNFKLNDVSVGGAISHYAIVAQHGLSVSNIICNLKGVAINYLEPLAAKYGRHNMIITSGFRLNTGRVNKAGKPSQHEVGEAIDVQFQNISDDEYWARAQWIVANVVFDQFILEYLGNRPWLHGSFSSSQRRNLVNTATTNGAYPLGLQKMR
jgi:hypothetical protein